MHYTTRNAAQLTFSEHLDGPVFQSIGQSHPLHYKSLIINRQLSTVEQPGPQEICNIHVENETISF